MKHALKIYGKWGLGRSGRAKREPESFGLQTRSAGLWVFVIFLDFRGFWSLFWSQLDPAGMPKSYFFCKIPEKWEKTRSRSRSGKNMKFCWKICVKMRRLEEWKQAFRSILPSRYEVLASLNFSWFWSPKSHEKSKKSGPLVARGWVFEILGGFYGVRNYDDFLILFDRQKVGQKLRFLRKVAIWSYPAWWFGRGRRRRRCSWSLRILKKSESLFSTLWPWGGRRI